MDCYSYRFLGALVYCTRGMASLTHATTSQVLGAASSQTSPLVHTETTIQDGLGVAAVAKAGLGVPPVLKSRVGQANTGHLARHYG